MIKKNIFKAFYLFFKEEIMDIKSFILANKEAIEKLAIKNDEEKIIKKKDDWYNEDCWDNLYEELKVGKKDE